MDFSWSPEQMEWLEAAEKFGNGRLDAGLVENELQGKFNQDGWKACAEFGIHGLSVPKADGGLGLDALTTVGILERLGYVCRDNGLLFSINAHLWTVAMPLVAFGTPEQKEKWLPSLCQGNLIGANATSERNAGSDAFGLQTTARREGDRYLLNGSKTFITNGPIADLYSVYATLDPAKGADGLCAFLVEKDAPGLTVGPKLEKMGLRTAQMGEITLEECEVPAAHRLGKEGAGASLFNHSMVWERGCILSNAVGSMQRLLETCIEYASTRKQFGQTIGKFQRVADRIVDMKVRLETSRHLLYQGAWLRSQGRRTYLESAMTKMYLSESWVRTCEDALQLHGGSGYLVENGLERELRDALASRIYSGTNDIQRSIIASMLGL